MEYKAVWLKGGIVLALNMLEAGRRVYQIGLGERDFYVDVIADSSLSLEEAENFATYKDHDFTINNGKVVSKFGEISLLDETKPSGNPRYFKILNVSVHHVSPDFQVVRIRAVAFETEEQLKDYLEWLEKASETDHRVLGEKMDLFSFHGGEWSWSSASFTLKVN